MNLILFSQSFSEQRLPWSDSRALHLRDILNLRPGDRFKAGFQSGDLGTLEVLDLDSQGVLVGSWQATGPSPGLYPLSLVVGTPRPPTARRLLKDLATLGVQEIHFCATDLGEKSYLQSHLWTRGEYLEALAEGAMQAGVTGIPQVHTHTSLYKALKVQESRRGFYFDFGFPSGLPPAAAEERPWALALGPERGWSDRERRILGEMGWEGRGLDPQRILRTETAAAAVTALALDRLRFWA